MISSNEAYKCSICSFELWHPISHLKVSVLGFYNDARFPGRCILALENHAVDFSNLEPDLAKAFILDAQAAARAITKVTETPRVNYAILGNQEPHLHFHLVPRGHLLDPIPTRTPWEHPDKLTELPAADVHLLKEQIRFALSSTLIRAEEEKIRS